MQTLRAVALRHPARVAALQGRPFVPNDVNLGGSAPGFILLTGPNMGGKSTLLRQVPGLIRTSLVGSLLCETKHVSFLTQVCESSSLIG